MFKLDLNKCSQFNKDNIDALNIDGNMDNKNIDNKKHFLTQWGFVLSALKMSLFWSYLQTEPCVEQFASGQVMWKLFPKTFCHNSPKHPIIKYFIVNDQAKQISKYGKLTCPSCSCSRPGWSPSSPLWLRPVIAIILIIKWSSSRWSMINDDP